MDQFESIGSSRYCILAAVVAAVAGLSGCSYISPKPVPAQAGADKVAVYEALPPDRRNFSLVKRLNAGPWTSAIAVPRYPSVAAGEDDLRNLAVALGGDAVINFGCYHSRVDRNSDYYCNGNVIKFVQ